MAHTFTRSLSATAAISAVLALGSTPAVAQEAAPAVQIAPPAVAPAVPETTTAPATAPSVTAPAAAPAPAIVLPDVSAATQSAPRPAPAAQAETATPVRNRARAAETAAPRRTAAVAATAQSAQAPARATASVPAAPASATPAERPRASSANILNDGPARPAAAPAAPRPATQPAGSDDGIPGEALAGLLALLGIGAVGFAAMSSRRRRDEADDVVYADKAVMAEPIRSEPIRDAELAKRPAAVFGTPEPVTQSADMRYDFAPARGDAGDTQVIERAPMAITPPIAPTERTRPASAMPTSMPATSDERTDLLDRMVDAEPDEANPFTSRKSRRKRARLLLQQREAESQREAPFDWRSYKSTSKPSVPAASPPLVTA